jgi:hypothetical protein
MWVKLVQFIHDISDWLEALGFIIGFITILKVWFLNRDVKELHSKHLFQVRVNDHISELKLSSRKISSLLSNFSFNMREIKLEVSKCIEHCNSIKKKVGVQDLTNLKPLIKRMRTFRDNKIENFSGLTKFQKLLRQKPISENEVDEIYMQLTSLITEIEHLKTDLKKSIK